MEAQLDKVIQNFISPPELTSQSQTDRPMRSKHWKVTQVALFAYYMSLARLTEPHKHFLAMRIWDKVRANAAVQASATP